MGSIKNLKKTINNELSDIIETCYDWQYINQKQANKAEAVIDEALNSFDNFIEDINKKVDNSKAHFKSIKSSLQQKKVELLEKLENL